NNISNATFYLYLIVSSLILLRLLYMLIRFGVNLSKHSRVERLYGKRVIVSDYWNQTFSFFGIIVLPQKDFQLKENQLLIEHELVHVKQYHTLDLLLAELFQVLHWFNPLAHFIKKDMREIHEFLADYCVVKGGASKYAYQQLLLNYLASSVTPRVANSFSAKLLKKRFAMMTTNKTPKSVLIKYTLAIPVIAILIGLMSFQTKVNYTYSTNIAEDIIEPVENISPAMDNIIISTPEGTVEKDTKAKVNVSIESSINKEIPKKIELLNKINIKPLKSKEVNNIVIVKSEDLKSKLLRIINANEGTYLKDYVVNSPSKNIMILKKGITYRFYLVWPLEYKNISADIILSPENKESLIENLNPIKTFKGKEHSYFDYYCENTGAYNFKITDFSASKYTIGLCMLKMDESFTNDSKKVEIVEFNSADKKDTSKRDYFVVVEEMPKFNNGGLGKARDYIAQNIKYPTNGIEGKVYVNFVVESNGKVSNVKIIKSINPDIDKEVVRVIENMPNWTPGKQKGKNVPVQFTIPVVFSLNDKPKSTETEQEVIKSTKGENYEPFIVVEQMPKFDNRDVDAAREYIAKNVKYPEVAAKNGIQGKVYVSFIIEEDGAVSNVKTERAVDPILDKEAIRVVESMPKWTPGYQRGLAVRVKIILPVGFKLDDKK
nr:M56 family metallopeptidase [Tenuifilaceae bacterium]